MFNLSFEKENCKMIVDKDKNIIGELSRLIKLRTLVNSEIILAEHNDEPDDMTITDLEEWLVEIDTELSECRNKKPAVSWLLEKYFSS